eukprot:CAMPEP_0178516856 /NCGR_PEP_ID=MMETSP0696-20121128/25358_1 /TAXON_ID=265572 /ORGANISM="Extubocellulus spinifer, Strain CCMP396" /LENGTH=428 /DNA_ID=CAMNT_0020147203 /DNA_START=40 /DNA_END=1326 /DNA_ORIENTATION=-
MVLLIHVRSTGSCSVRPDVATTLLLALFLSATSYGDVIEIQGTDDLVDWIKSRGGFVDPRQEVRMPYPDDTHSSPFVRGVFAKDDISSGDLLLDLPINDTCIVADASQGDTPDQCGTVRALRRELALGEGSRFAPYVKLLLEQSNKGLVDIPNAWSGNSLKLLDAVVGPNLAPRDNRRHLEWWERSCAGSTYSDKLGADAALLMVARSAGVYDFSSEVKEGEGRRRGTVMVPYYDLYNHRNGLWQNVRIDADLSRSYKVYARRDIEKGEQIYNHYGEGTDDLFRDYGFVERTPQLWRFTVPETVVDGAKHDACPVRFWLDYENSVEGSQLALEWVERPVSIESANLFFNQERERLMTMKNWYDENSSGLEDIPNGEAEKIWAYHRALSTALWGIVEAMNKGVAASEAISHVAAEEPIMPEVKGGHEEL